MKAFKAYDIRGVYNTDFNKDDVYKIGFWLAKQMNISTILVGRDVRLSSDEIFDYLCRGINDAGVDVDDTGIGTTPYIYWTTAQKGYGCSVMITASHNPKNHNGLKVSGKNASPIGYDNGLQTVESKLDHPIIVEKQRGVVKKVDYKSEYLQFLLSYKHDLSGLKIAMDCSNGMAGLFVKQLFGEQPHYLYEVLDGTFPNHEANPLIPENVRDLENLVIQTKADIGVIYDGDADRVMFTDEQGKFVQPDLIIAVLAHYFLEERHQQGKVIQDIRTSKAVGEYIARFGSEMEIWRVGRAYAATKLREIDGIYGGELAGHYYSRDFFYSDSGLLASILVLNIIHRFKKEGVTFSQLIAKISRYQNSGEINFRIEHKEEAMKAVTEYFSQHEKPTKLLDFDGYRMEFPEWWFNIRPSNTEPFLRFIAEAATKAMLDEKVAITKKILQPFE
ncbi:MAG: phosphomannomutase/phosphoglucomutase [Bacteroidales bacterium]|nr:phosphomannomutase/phosphoglucomutase [Bacteroidales bacterium]